MAGNSGRKNVKPSARSAGTSPRVDEHAQRQIGRHLQAMFDGYLNEPLPDRIASLLAQLDEQDESKPADDDAPDDPAPGGSEPKR